MPQGLQVWNSDNVLILDITDRVVKFLTEDDVVEGTTTNITIAPDATSSVIVAPVADIDRTYTPAATVTTGNVAVTWPSGSSGITRDILLLEF